MKISWPRRIVALLMAVTLGLGMATQDLRAADMAGKMAAAVAATDGPMKGICDDCGGGNMATGICHAAMCFNFTALPSMALEEMLSCTALVYVIEAHRLYGRTAPPDLHPPQNLLIA